MDIIYIFCILVEINIYNMLEVRDQLKGKSEAEVYKICLEMEDYYFKEDYISLWRNNTLTEEQIVWYLDNKVK